MPQCQTFGKDTVCFATKEELSQPSTVALPAPEQPSGLILDNGDINWNCPCLGGMATGPCGVQFREAFSCFHYSENEPKGNRLFFSVVVVKYRCTILILGAECLEAFQTMQECMKGYPTLYKQSDADDDNDVPNLADLQDDMEHNSKIEQSTAKPQEAGLQNVATASK